MLRSFVRPFEEPPRRRAARLETKRASSRGSVSCASLHLLHLSLSLSLCVRIPLPSRSAFPPRSPPFPVTPFLFLYYYVFAIYLCLHPPAFYFLLHLLRRSFARVVGLLPNLPRTHTGPQVHFSLRRCSNLGRTRAPATHGPRHLLSTSPWMIREPLEQGTIHCDAIKVCLIGGYTGVAEA